MTVHFDTSPEARVKRELDEDEHLLWVECPEANEVARRSWGTSVTGIFVTVFALSWLRGAMHMARPHGFGPPPPGAGLFSLFGLLFLGFGLPLIFAPFFNAVKAARTIYALTDRRALIIEDGTTERVQSFGPRDIERIERRERPNGLGDLLFARRLVRRSGRRHHRYEREVGFLSVKRVKEAERFMRQYLLKAE